MLIFITLPTLFKSLTMGKVQLLGKQLEYDYRVDQRLKSFRISIENETLIVFRGRKIPQALIEGIIHKKAKWILNRIEILRNNPSNVLADGSELSLFGKIVEVKIKWVEPDNQIQIKDFENKMELCLSKSFNSPQALNGVLEHVYVYLAQKHIPQRVQMWSVKMQLFPSSLKFKIMKSRWGSCSGRNSININANCVKLPWELIDYLVVHELSHIKVKNHSKDFYLQMERYLPNARKLDKRMRDYVI